MADFDSVTCGSVIKLTHTQSGFKLHSHEIPYGTGSRQQSVTAFPGTWWLGLLVVHEGVGIWGTPGPEVC